MNDSIAARIGDLLDHLGVLADRLQRVNDDLATCDATAVSELLTQALDEREQAWNDWQRTLAALADLADRLPCSPGVPGSVGPAGLLAQPGDVLARLSARSEPHLTARIVRLRQGLAGLVAGDERVRHHLGDLLASVRRDLGQIRAGGRLLKGYSPVDVLDSCFIDRRR